MPVGMGDFGAAITVLDLKGKNKAVEFTDGALPNLTSLRVRCTTIKLQALPNLTSLRVQLRDEDDSMRRMAERMAQLTAMLKRDLPGLDALTPTVFHLGDGLPRLTCVHVSAQPRGAKQALAALASVTPLLAVKLTFRGGREHQEMDPKDVVKELKARRMTSLALVWKSFLTTKKKKAEPCGAFFDWIAEVLADGGLESLCLGGMCLPRGFVEQLSLMTAPLQCLELKGCTLKDASFLKSLRTSTSFRLGLACSRIRVCRIRDCALDAEFTKAMASAAPTTLALDWCGSHKDRDVMQLSLSAFADLSALTTLSLAGATLPVSSFAALHELPLVELNLCGANFVDRAAVKFEMPDGGWRLLLEMQLRGDFPKLPATLRQLDISIALFLGARIPVTLAWLQCCPLLTHLAAAGQPFPGADEGLLALFGQLRVLTMNERFQCRALDSAPHLVMRRIEMTSDKFPRAVCKRYDRSS